MQGATTGESPQSAVLRAERVESREFVPRRERRDGEADEEVEKRSDCHLAGDSHFLCNWAPLSREASPKGIGRGAGGEVRTTALQSSRNENRC